MSEISITLPVQSTRSIDDRLFRFAAKLTDQQLAASMSALVNEYVGRATASREMELMKAKESWPHLRSALQAVGRRISSVHWGSGPVLTSWCFYPVACCHGYHGRKPRSKRAAMQIALTFGDHWATMGELWQWVQGTGPIVHRVMHRFGYGGPGPETATVSELYPWPPTLSD